jgi:hypothetical protein
MTLDRELRRAVGPFSRKADLGSPTLASYEIAFRDLPEKVREALGKPHKNTSNRQNVFYEVPTKGRRVFLAYYRWKVPLRVKPARFEIGINLLDADGEVLGFGSVDDDTDEVSWSA